MQQPADAFETQLEAMFADPPPAPDADVFALALEQRIAQETRRRALVYAACSLGALFIAGLIFVLGGAFSGTAGVVERLAGTFDVAWFAPVGSALVVLLGVWVISELTPDPYRR